MAFAVIFFPVCVRPARTGRHFHGNDFIPQKAGAFGQFNRQRTCRLNSGQRERKEQIEQFFEFIDIFDWRCGLQFLGNNGSPDHCLGDTPAVAIQPKLIKISKNHIRESRTIAF